jgi:tellurite resistance-related uncharacterized protein
MRTMVPIVKIKFDQKDAYPLDLLDIFEESGHWNRADEYTFTGRFTLDPEHPNTPEVKEEITDRIHEVLDPEQANRILALLDDNDWDVSFYADAW